ncbi:threonine/serine ThrE exporter family protein [Ruania halotolerans]|uniref:threonine/serine ThrE exporter family protein n=1 Tax=Ruania halotolerans TaxID=2897773 RepID=UPI001E2EF20A|nr:threonine/serine exporter family protein [Ruania halotolerans]UFU06662.1 threonine/serine exporter family protein [Ruania halotolerans]
MTARPGPGRRPRQGRRPGARPADFSSALPPDFHSPRSTQEFDASPEVDTDGVPDAAPVPTLRPAIPRRSRPDAPGRKKRGTGSEAVPKPVWSLRDQARRMVAGYGPPSVPFPGSRHTSELSAEEERAVLDLVLRAGEAMLATGAPVADATAEMLRMSDGLGVKNLTVDITFISLTATIDRADDPVTKVRVINTRTSDYSRLTDISRLISQISERKVAITEADTRLTRILTSPHPYRRAVVTVALGIMAAGVAVLLGGGWAVAMVAAATTMTIDRILRFLRHRGLPYLFQQVVGAGIATVVGVMLLWGQNHVDWDRALMPPSLVVASGIVVLLAGLSLVGAAEDAISGFPLTAAARSFEVVLGTMGIVVGIGIVLEVGRRIGVPLSVGDLNARANVPFLTRVLASAVIAAAWSVASYTRLRTVALVAAVAAAAAAVYELITLLGNGINEDSSGVAAAATPAFVAALAVGLLAGAVCERVSVPTMVISVCGVTPFLPGLSIYGAMYNIVDSGGFLIEGLDLLVRAGSVGLALAAGVTLGEFLATPLTSEADKWQRKMMARARGSRI